MCVTGRASARQRPADRGERGVSAGPVQPRGHGDPEEVHVPRGQRQGHDPAGAAAVPATGTHTHTHSSHTHSSHTHTHTHSSHTHILTPGLVGSVLSEGSPPERPFTHLAEMLRGSS